MYNGTMDTPAHQVSRDEKSRVMVIFHEAFAAGTEAGISGMHLTKLPMFHRRGVFKVLIKAY